MRLPHDLHVNRAACARVQVPFEALKYLTGECNYGGRVTDDLDRRLLATMLADVYRHEAVATAHFKLSPTSGTYSIPADGSLKSHNDFIRSLPLNDTAQAFGLHENAEIAVALSDAHTLLSTASAFVSASARQDTGAHAAPDSKDDKPASTATGSAEHAGMTRADAALYAMAVDIVSKLPPAFDVERVEVLYPVDYNQCLNTVLVQECIRFNGVIQVVRASLLDIQKALRGVSIMSAELEAVALAMAQGRVPAAWKAVSYPSVKPLASWVLDLVQRLAFLQQWIDAGPPAVFWISGFFFTQSFLTGVRQNFARRHKLPIDELAYDFHVLPTAACEQHAAGKLPPPTDGAIVTGLFLQGARWDASAGCLAESMPRELFTPLPLMHLCPRRTTDIDAEAKVYDCPVYKESLRAGTLSTTGHSTNLIMTVKLPVGPAHSVSHWIKRGVALISQLDV
ncbi:hypothetical protein EON66_00035 [archaeon]|nr:MAG: hypothetical protein EON66_00035 [archaeon]